MFLIRAGGCSRGPHLNNSEASEGDRQQRLQSSHQRRHNALWPLGSPGSWCWSKTESLQIACKNAIVHRSAVMGDPRAGTLPPLASTA